MKLKEGDVAPDFSLNDQDGILRNLHDFYGKWLVLYFYPKDFTSGCTTEACTLQENFAELYRFAQIVGISKDSVESHRKFADEHNLRFTLLADVKEEVHKLYDTHALLLNKRTTFLINPNGHIVKIYENVNPQIHAEEIVNDLRALQ